MKRNEMINYIVDGINGIFRVKKKSSQKFKKTDCECTVYCGAGDYSDAYILRFQHCSTIIKRQLEFLNHWPWTEISKGNSVVTGENGKFLYVEKPNGEKVYEPE